MNFIITILILFIMLGLIISIHEFGHFIAAKKSGVYVEEFSLGMGLLIKQFKPKKSETKYSLRAFPIGGYVAMAEREMKGSKIKKDRVLENKGFLKNLWVMANGIIFNCLLAILLFFISGLLYGKPISEVKIGEVIEGKAAYNAGLEAGDKILEINGVEIETWDDFTLEVSAKKLQKEYVFKVEKSDGKVGSYKVVPEIVEENGEEVRVFGIKSSVTTYKKGFGSAVNYAFTGFYETTTTILKILGSLFTGDVSIKNLSGPVGIYSVVDQVKSQGFQTLIYLTAYLSINVAIINLVPVPVFDGGRILVLIIEKITKKRTSEDLELKLNYIGFGIMLLLFVFITFNDIIRLVVK